MGDDPTFKLKPDYDFNQSLPKTESWPCNQVCGKRVCQAYQNRYNNYLKCKFCKGKNMCYDPKKKTCVKSSKRKLNIPCESRDSFGCINPEGNDSNLYPDVPPINPAYNDCTVCWRSS